MQNGFRQLSLFCCTNLQRTKHFYNLPPRVSKAVSGYSFRCKSWERPRNNKRSNDTTYVQTVHTPARKGEDTVTTMQHKNSRIGTEFLSLSTLFLCPLRIAFSSPFCPLFHYLRRYHPSCLNNRDSTGFHMKRKERGLHRKPPRHLPFPPKTGSKKVQFPLPLLYNRNTLLLLFLHLIWRLWCLTTSSYWCTVAWKSWWLNSHWMRTRTTLESSRNSFSPSLIWMGQ